MADKSLPRCAVIIPTYNGARLLRGCLEALLKTPPTSCSAEIVVVDDASSDGTLAMIDKYGPAVRTVALADNSGFALACNSGARAADSSDHLVFLNNDTLPTAGWLDELVRCVQEDDDVAAVGARLLFPDGTVQHAGVAIGQDRWPHHIYAGFPGEHPAVTRPRRMVAVTAACMLIRRPDFERCGGFDTEFRNGYEDIDLCLRLRELGRRVQYAPASVVYHLESVTRWSERPEPTEHNDRLYDERWRNRVRPDDVQHYIDDGLLNIEYGPYYPVKMTISPLVATVAREDETGDALERLLATRSRQVMELLAAQTRAVLKADASGHFAPTNGSRRGRSMPRLLATGRTHEIGQGAARHLVSLLMPVKNEARSLRELLPLVLDQAFPTLLEIVAVDSGSDDDTLDVLSEYGATIVAIEPHDFDHGLTRNLAAEHARGDVLVFLNGRSRPVGREWLGPLVGTLDEDPAIAGVCSRVTAHPSADLLLRHDIELELSGAKQRQRKQIIDWRAYAQMPNETRRAFLNFHTVSAALRADTFSRLRFRSVKTIGEDLLWAREVVEGGYALVHEPASVVYHSHLYTLRELFSRNVDDGIANRDIVGRALAASDVRPLIEALADRDWAFLSGEAELGGEDLQHWQREAMLRRVAQATGQWLGSNYKELPDGVAMSFSRIGEARRSGRRSAPQGSPA